MSHLGAWAVVVIVAVACCSCGGDGGDRDRETGIPELDRVMRTVESRPLPAALGPVAFSVLGCTTASGAGGPPKCAPGEADGAAVSAFEFYSCEVDWRRADELDDALAQWIMTQPRRFAAFDIPDEYRPGRLRDAAAVAKGDYVVVFQGTGPGGTPRGSAAVVDRAGNIVAVLLACGAGDGAETLIPSSQDDFLLSPPE